MKRVLDSEYIEAARARVLESCARSARTSVLYSISIVAVVVGFPSEALP